MHIVSSNASPHSLGKRLWNYMYIQAFRHQQVILIQCMGVISQVCLRHILPSIHPKLLEMASGSFTFEYREYALF